MNEDQRLYGDFLEGNQMAFNTLILKYKNNVIYFISRYVKSIDIAEELFQDVILYVLENKEKYNSNYSFKTYLYIIAKSKSLNYLKKYNKQTMVLEEITDTVSEDKLLDIIFSNERKEKISKVISQLKTEYQLVIYLTQIEGLSYNETSRILNKTEKQIKNLVYNAKKSFKKLLIKEKVVEYRNNKFIRLLSWIIIVGIITSGITLATVVIKNILNNAKLNPSFSGSIGNINENKVWVGTFQIAWNDLMEEFGGPIEFENEASLLATELNQQSFTKDMITEESYYIEQGAITPQLKEKITNDIQNKFNMHSEFLDGMDWNTSNNEYLIYSMLKKSFTFASPFMIRNSSSFGNSQENVKYFGLEKCMLEDAYEQVTILFYNSRNDFAIKIDTIEGEEIILYRTDNISNFSNTYSELEQKTKAYTGSKYMQRQQDELRIPFIDVSAIINYDTLCNKYIKNTEHSYIKYAIQTVNFSLNNYGGNLTSEALIDMYISEKVENPRCLEFNDTFVLYLKESSKKTPYFALLVDNTDVLIKD